MQITPVILSGGSGNRLWPLSNTRHPKQLVSFFTQNSMLQETALRIRGTPFAEPLILCNESQRFLVAEQLRMAGITPQRILLEPVGRNTAPAVAIAALSLASKNPEALMLVLPSDHIIKQGEEFRSILVSSVAAAQQGKLILFGISPCRPETNYGYIKASRPFSASPPCFFVECFHEKPDFSKALFYLQQGNYYWNSGIFLFTAGSFLQELAHYNPRMLELCRLALDKARHDADFSWLDENAFQSIESNSIDYAVMERTQKAVMIPLDVGWNDVGDWSAIWQESDKDVEQNVLIGNTIGLNVRGSYIRSEGPLTTVVGLEDVVVVATKDSVLVVAKDKTNHLRNLIKQIREKEPAL